MLLTIFLILLFLLVLTIVFAETKKFQFGYIFAFFICVFIGAMLFQEGLTLGYAQIIQENYGGDTTLTKVSTDTNQALATILKTNNEPTIFWLANLFTYGSFIFFVLYLFRADSFEKQRTYERFSGE